MNVVLLLSRLARTGQGRVSSVKKTKSIHFMFFCRTVGTTGIIRRAREATLHLPFKGVPGPSTLVICNYVRKPRFAQNYIFLCGHVADGYPVVYMFSFFEVGGAIAHNKEGSGGDCMISAGVT